MTPEVCALHHCISSLHSLSGPLTWVTEGSLVVQGKLQASTVLWHLLTSSTAFGLDPTPLSMSPSCSCRRAHHHSRAAHACAQMTCDLHFHCPNMDISVFSNGQSGTGPDQPWPALASPGLMSGLHVVSCIPRHCVGTSMEHTAHHVRCSVGTFPRKEVHSCSVRVWALLAMCEGILCIGMLCDCCALAPPASSYPLCSTSRTQALWYLLTPQNAAKVLF